MLDHRTSAVMVRLLLASDVVQFLERQLELHPLALDGWLPCHRYYPTLAVDRLVTC